jgi:hypothetical protein
MKGQESMFRILYLNSFKIPRNGKHILSEDLIKKADLANSQILKNSGKSKKKSKVGLDYVGEPKDSKLRIL